MSAAVGTQMTKVASTGAVTHDIEGMGKFFHANRDRLCQLFVVMVHVKNESEADFLEIGWIEKYWDLVAVKPDLHFKAQLEFETLVKEAEAIAARKIPKFAKLPTAHEVGTVLKAIQEAAEVVFIGAMREWVNGNSYSDKERAVILDFLILQLQLTYETLVKRIARNLMFPLIINWDRERRSRRLVFEMTYESEKQKFLDLIKQLESKAAEDHLKAQGLSYAIERYQDFERGYEVGRDPNLYYRLLPCFTPYESQVFISLMNPSTDWLVSTLMQYDALREEE